MGLIQRSELISSILTGLLGFITALYLALGPVTCENSSPSSCHGMIHGGLDPYVAAFLLLLSSGAIGLLLGTYLQAGRDPLWPVVVQLIATVLLAFLALGVPYVGLWVLPTAVFGLLTTILGFVVWDGADAIPRPSLAAVGLKEILTTATILIGIVILGLAALLGILFAAGWTIGPIMP